MARVPAASRRSRRAALRRPRARSSPPSRSSSRPPRAPGPCTSSSSSHRGAPCRSRSSSASPPRSPSSCARGHRAGRSSSSLGKHAPTGGPLIDTATTACDGAAGSFYCKGSYEPLPRARTRSGSCAARAPGRTSSSPCAGRVGSSARSHVEPPCEGPVPEPAVDREHRRVRLVVVGERDRRAELGGAAEAVRLEQRREPPPAIGRQRPGERRSGPGRSAGRRGSSSRATIVPSTTATRLASSSTSGVRQNWLIHSSSESASNVSSFGMSRETLGGRAPRSARGRRSRRTARASTSVGHGERLHRARVDRRHAGRRRSRRTRERVGESASPPARRATRSASYGSPMRAEVRVGGLGERGADPLAAAGRVDGRASRCPADDPSESRTRRGRRVAQPTISPSLLVRRTCRSPACSGTAPAGSGACPSARDDPLRATHAGASRAARGTSSSCSGRGARRHATGAVATSGRGHGRSGPRRRPRLASERVTVAPPEELPRRPQPGPARGRAPPKGRCSSSPARARARRASSPTASRT